jgi:5-methylcytosine-specific restriction endonuclease McrA
MRLGWSTPAEAFCMMMGESKDGGAPALALDIAYQYDEYGKPNTDKALNYTPFEWEYWMELEPRKGDLDKVIHTSKRIIRIPTVLICSHFHLMPNKRQKPTASAIRERDGNRCQYTGVPLTNKTFSLDHIVPRSKGGKDSWQNLVAAHKDVNSRKGNAFNHEIGYKLLKQPLAPRDAPLCVTVKGEFHPDHQHF